MKNIEVVDFPDEGHQPHVRKAHIVANAIAELVFAVDYRMVASMPNVVQRVYKTIVTLVAISLTACAAPTHDDRQITIIENVTTIDAVNGVRQNVDVIIADNNIEAVSSDAGNRFLKKYKPATLTNIDGTGKYLIPGLWDGHVHLTYADGINHETFFPLAIAHGITSLRDIGGHLDQLAQARQIAITDKKAPNLYISGPLLDGPLRVYDGSSRFFANLSVGISNIEEAKQHVDKLAKAGVDFVKAYEMLPPDVFAAIAQRAKIHGLPVAAHVPLSTTLRNTAGDIDDMQHLRNLEFACASNREALLQERRDLISENDAPNAGALRGTIHNLQRPNALAAQDQTACDEAIELLVENRIIQTPTLAGNRFAVKPIFANASYRESFALMPPDITQSWQSLWKRFWPTDPSDAALALDAWMHDIIKRLDKRGVLIMAGTDAPIGFQTPGASLHEELVALVDAGLSPLTAIGAATHVPAVFFGIENETGAIAPTMTADLVLLNADPLINIRNVSSIEAVFKNGLLIDRAELDGLMAIPSQAGQ